MKRIIALSLMGLAAAGPLDTRATPTATTMPKCTQPEPVPQYANDNTICPCYDWDEVGRGEDCAAVGKRNGVSEETIIKWNPWSATVPLHQGFLGRQPLHVTHHPPPPPPCQTNPPQGYREDTVCHCKKWHTSGHKDTCEVLQKDFGITRGQLVQMNPWLELKNDDGSILSPCIIVFVGEVICVGL